MPWSKKLSQLNDALGELVALPGSIEKFVKNAGLRPQMISFNGTAMDIWSSAISEADKQHKVENLIQAVLEQYPDNPFLLAALDDANINYSLAPDIDKVSNWKEITKDTLEVLTNEVNTLLPISFLQKGVLISRSVGKIQINRSGFVDVGTGFLFSLPGEQRTLFMTNYHVLPSADLISKTKIIFDFELDINGESKATKSFKINKDALVMLSPTNELDLCVVCLDDINNELSQFGFIPLEKTLVEKNSFVNIIQHPGGQMKQISLYHNIVTHVTDNLIQYLTDTSQGSSGSPVFNSDWQIVALHHSGGPRRENEPQLPYGFKSRNEGISINPIIDFICKGLTNE